MFRRALIPLVFAVLVLVACQNAAETPQPTPDLSTPTVATVAMATTTPTAVPTQTPTATPPSEWVYRTNGEVFSSPVLSDDGTTIYFGGIDYLVYALDKATGAERWTFETGDQVISSPALADGTLYIGGTDGMLYALDAGSGDLRWQTPVGIVVSSPAVDNGTVYTAAISIDMEAGEANGKLIAADAATGSILWEYSLDGPIISSPAVDNGVVYVGGPEETVALDAATGELVWQSPTGPTESSPTVANGLVYIGIDDGYVVALDVATGVERWRFESELGFVSTPRSAAGLVYIGGLDGNIYALDAATGEEVWRLATLEPIVSSPLIDDGRVYIGSLNGRLYALDAATGTLEWFYQTADAIWSSPLVDADRVYFGGFDHNFYAVNRDQPQLAAAAIPRPTPLALQPTPLPPPGPRKTADDGDLPWWNDRTFYEVFVRSFQDSDGDGIGDLQGLIDRLDYLNDGDPATTDDLGVTGIWLMPIAQSPSYHGYDVTDYFTIEEDYGTNEDFQRLLEEAHKRGIAVIVDLVMNHTSSEHPWFLDARRPGSPHESWYIWDTMPDFWFNPWGGVAWHQIGLRYYFGMFWEGMPDLNYRNGEVTDEMYDIIHFWLDDMAVDGFRLDAIRHLIEDGEVQANTPETHAWLQGFYNYVHDLNPDALTVGEVWDETAAVVPYVGDEVDIAFEFQLAEAIIDSLLIRNNTAVYTAWEGILGQYPAGQYAPFLTNHDQDRIINQLRGDEAAAKVAAGLVLTSPGVPFIYYGEEIGMSGVKPDEQIRTPMQWGINEAGGPAFTSGEPWEPLQANWATRTVESQVADPASLLSTYRTLIHLRN
ncbi:MAG: alpha-amylase family glycosyl hydrolase, partial [Chloroflexota bacterium]